MEPIRRVSGAAVPLLDDDVNTDQIIPAAWLKDLHPDLATGLFGYRRRRPDGTPNADFVLEQPQYAGAPILVAGANFGCGSSREHAVWALRAFGVRCVISPAPAEFFRDNCLRNGVLPVVLPPAEMADLAARVVAVDGSAPFTVDLEECTIAGPDGFRQSFVIAPHERIALLEGLDDIGVSLRHADEIRAWEQRTAATRPFLQAAIDHLAR